MQRRKQDGFGEIEVNFREEMFVLWNAKKRLGAYSLKKGDVWQRDLSKHVDYFLLFYTTFLDLPFPSLYGPRTQRFD